MNKAVLSGILLVLSIQMLGAEATLKERWSTASDFKVPESVFFDPEAGCLYVLRRRTGKASCPKWVSADGSWSWNGLRD
jgi:hypothetical protein